MTSALSMGAVYGGSDGLMPQWKAAIDALMWEFVVADEVVDPPFNVNIVFVVSGSVYRAEFDDIRISNFRRTDNAYMASVAESADWLPVKPMMYLQGRAEAAFEQCERRALRAGRITSALEGHRRVLAKIRQAVERRGSGEAEPH